MNDWKLNYIIYAVVLVPNQRHDYMVCVGCLTRFPAVGRLQCLHILWWGQLKQRLQLYLN